ncbi:hypothetical protein KFE98_14685 [bacterium SCSIO 12741]|nr:hypothetical protein KFE98_14685 [bacterium SCSIO 12741]
MFPRWTFFFFEVICYGSLGLAGTLIFFHRKTAFYLYHYFFFSFIYMVSVSQHDIPGWWDHLEFGLCFFCLLSIYLMRWSKIYSLFQLKKPLHLLGYPIIAGVTFLFSELPYFF